MAQADLLVRGPLLVAGAALIPVGVSMHVAGHAPEWAAWLALGASAVALLWSVVVAFVRPAARMQLVAGTGVATAVLAAAGIATARGHADAQTQSEKTARVQALANAGVQEFSGWVGRIADGGVVMFATQLDQQSPIGQMIAHTFARPVVPIVIGVDNRGGAAAISLDVTSVILELDDGSKRPLVDRKAILASAQGPEREAVLAQHSGLYEIPAGGRLGNAIAFADPQAPLARTVAIDLVANGHAVRIPGRFMSAAEKQALRHR